MIYLGFVYICSGSYNIICYKLSKDFDYTTKAIFGIL